MKVLLILVFSCFISLSQQYRVINNNLDRDLFLSVSPFYLQYEGIKLNFEKKDSRRSSSYSLSPIIYYGELGNVLFHQMSNPSSGDIAGGGLEFAYRYYILPDISFEQFNFFIGFVSSYNYANLAVNKDVYVDDVIDGLPAKTIARRDLDITLQRFNMNLLIGGVWVFQNYFSLSGEVQYGLNFSNASEEFTPVNDFNSSFFLMNGNDYYIDIKMGVWLNNFF